MVSEKTNHADSYYAASANPAPALPVLEGELSCDVCVIGAGLTGCSTALNLAERGYDVVVLEGSRVGWGASGRSGGQLIAGYAADMDDLAALVGELDAQCLWRMSLEAVALVREQVARYHIDCDLKKGHLLAAIKPRQCNDLRQWALTLRSRYGYDVLQYVARDELSEFVGSERYLAGLYDPGGGHLHPLNYTLGLARAAQAAGARFFEATPVQRVAGGDAPVMHTERGVVRARHLVYCCNAYIHDLQPRLRLGIMPVGTYVIATEPLGEMLATDLLRRDCSVADANFVLDYFRLSADQRLLFGGGVSYSTLPPPRLTESMRRRMLKVFPQLQATAIDYTWGGNVAITINRAPHLGRLNKNTYFAQGFSGHGIAITGLAGKLMAEAIAGSAERFDVFARIPHRAFPGGRWLRTPGLMLGMLYYRLRDML